MTKFPRLLGHRCLWLFALICVAIAYYGSYYRCGINFRDEGGTVALIAKRMLAGERPFIDVDPGYNLLWFYPVVGLFKLFGVNFVLLRAYCFVLSTLTAVLGFLCVDRMSNKRWLAFLAGLLLVLVPGMTFKNYMPLMAVANIYCLLQFAMVDPRTQGAAGQPPARLWRWLAIGSFVLGLTLLIRIDVGLFMGLLWIGAISIVACDSFFTPTLRRRILIGGPLLLISIVLALHFPVWLDAKRRGFDKEFVDNYAAWPKSIVDAVSQRIKGPRQSEMPRTSPPPVETILDPAARGASAVPLRHSWNSDVLGRPGWSDFLHPKKKGRRELVILLYAPLLTLAPLVIWAASGLCLALKRKESDALHRHLAALLALGGALTVFPQYFFFRPDAPHLSEFSPGFWIAAVCATILLTAGLQVRRWARCGLLALLLLHASLYLNQMLANRYSGTIDAKRNRRTMFHGANGVNVFLTKDEFQGLTTLVKVIRAHSSTGDYLVAYPYHPAINLITDLPTYERSLYVDNAMHRRDWEERAIERLEHYRPAVIVLSDWDINGTDSSRFSVWATRTKAWIQAHYDYQGAYMTHEQFEVYTKRPDPQGSPTGI